MARKALEETLKVEEVNVKYVILTFYLWINNDDNHTIYVNGEKQKQLNQ